LVFFVFCCLRIVACGAEPVPACQVPWKTILSYGNWTDTRPAVMKISDGYLVTSVSNRKTDKEIYETKVVLWKLDAMGKELWVKDLNIPGLQPDRPFLPSDCFSLQDEPVLLIIETLGPKPRRAWLVRLDEAGDVMFSKELQQRQIFGIQGFAKANDGFLLYGSVHKSVYKQEPNSDACVIKMDRAGNEVWRREYDKGKMELGTDLAPQKDGGFVLAADSGIYNKFGGGPSIAWIIKCDKNGGIVSETTFEGRHPTVAVNGITTVVTNRADFPQQDMAVVGLDGELKTLWQIESLFGKTGGGGLFRIIVNQQGDFVLAGNKFLTARLWIIDKKGRCLRECEIEDAKHCVIFDCLFETPEGFLIAGGVPHMSALTSSSEGKFEQGIQRDNMNILVAEVAVNLR
jgi:hypothetical protein